MKRTAAVLAGLCLVALGIVCAVPAFATGTPPPNTNEVAYWCGGSDMGVKYDNLNSTSFTVPAPPDGKTWVLLVLKAGSDQSVEHENETFTNPVVGQSYSHSSGKTLSHAILCYGYATTTTGASTTAPSTTLATTTTMATTTTGATTTGGTTTVVVTNPQTVPTTIATTTTAPTTTQATTSTIGTTTTAPFVTNPCPGSGCPQTTPPTTPTTVPATTSPPTTAATTTTEPVTTTVAPSATTSVGQELPHTGPGATSRDLALAVFLIFAGSATVKWAGASRRRA